MWQRLRDLAVKPARIGVGLMSGTSVDGIDAALVRIEGHGPTSRIEFLATRETPWPDDMRARIFSAFNGRAEELCLLHAELGRHFARAAIEVAETADLAHDAIDFIASHGQTVHHVPPDRRPGQPVRRGAGLQLGDGDVIAAETGCVTLTDFRSSDLAAGGDGAPLVPLFDCYILGDASLTRAVGNIGGIANITLAASDPAQAIAFDTGPGNALIDAVAHAADATARCDYNGALAARGTVNEELLAELLAHPYFARKPPKSTGRELFGEEFVMGLLRRTERSRLPDLAATLTELTARTLVEGVRRLPGPGVRELILSGGGVHNPVLMMAIRRNAREIAVRVLDELGIPGDFKEAAAFALIANETLHGAAGNVPAATGASRPAVLGKISLP